MRKASRNVLVALCVVALGSVGVYFYVHKAYPAVRCEGAVHLTAPGDIDCISCHAKVSARSTQDWLESKHGVMLVKCVVCHGEPDGNGSVPFARIPDPNIVCARCHDPEMTRMTQKFGDNLDCYGCHPRHQNGIHSDAYEGRTPTTKIEL